MKGTAGDPLDNTTDVETPERIRFRHRVAGPVRRALAWIIDWLIRGVALFGVWVLGRATGLGDGLERSSQGLMLVAFFVAEWGYNVLFEAWGGGRTPGKRLLGLRVVKEGGFPVGFIDAFLRNTLRAADFLPLFNLLGLFVMAGDRRFRRLGDHVAGTMVVIEEAARVAAPIVLTPPATADELAALPGRPPLAAEELDALELFLRRTSLALARQQELAELVAPVLARRMGLTAQDPLRFLGLVHLRAQGGRNVVVGGRR